MRAPLAGVLALLCAALSLAAPPSAGAQPGPLAFGACAPTQVVVPAAGLQCATLQVPFDRSDPALGSIALAVQRVPASAPRTGTIVLLAGGPGQPALPAFEASLAPLAHEPALRGFELVTFDQRGTGQSEGLQCPEANGSLNGGLAPYFGACGAALGPTRAFYTSQETVEDLDALRQALGGAPLSLFAVSYGGRVAGMYAREHPQGVARMVLDSPTPLTGPDPLQSARLRALRRVLDEGICGAGACRSFSADLFADLTRLVATLHRRPLRTRIYDARGRLRRASVTEAGVLHLLSGLDLAKGARELAPATIAAAAHGNAVPLARLTSGLAAESPGSHLAAATAPATSLPPGPLGGESFKAQAPLSDSIISLALFAATYCDESELPWSPDSPPEGRTRTLRGWLATQPAQAFAPFAPSTVVAGSALQLCMDWPATPPAPPSPTGVSAVPTLLLSGDDDLRTPYEQTLAVAAGYGDGQLLRVPDVGHSTVTTDLTGCAKRAMIEFLTAGQAPASCPGSSEPQALPLPPSSLSRLPAAASGSRVAGQVATAAAMTIEDLFGQTSFSGGGLRGGYWAQQPVGFVLHGMIDVPGVALSGAIHVSGSLTGLPAISGHLTVRGRLAGTLTLHGLALSGRVGGAPAHARLAAL
ncbi:MAG: alpha/beta hydrolase [Solirubrobacteraceae bacterium]